MSIVIPPNLKRNIRVKLIQSPSRKIVITPNRKVNIKVKLVKPSQKKVIRSPEYHDYSRNDFSPEELVQIDEILEKHGEELSFFRFCYILWIQYDLVLTKKNIQNRQDEFDFIDRIIYLYEEYNQEYKKPSILWDSGRVDKYHDHIHLEGVNDLIQTLIQSRLNQ